MPWYNPHIKTQLTPKQFFKLLEAQDLGPAKNSLLILLFYTGIRVSEALRLERKSFFTDPDSTTLYVKVGKRLKRGKITKDLPLSFLLEGVAELWEYTLHQEYQGKVWRFHRQTAYRACKKLGLYPHYFRFNLASHFAETAPISKFMQWFGWRKAETAMSYVAELDILELGEALTKW